MARTVAMEEWPADVQRVVEDLLSCGEPIYLSRQGQRVGGLLPYEAAVGIEEKLSPEEEEEILAIIKQGEEDFDAGRYITFDELKARLAPRLQRG